jgi:hypothetical protein
MSSIPFMIVDSIRMIGIFDSSLNDLKAPDEVFFLVSTSIADMWHVTCLRREGKNYYDDGKRFHESQPSELVKLTKR